MSDFVHLHTHTEYSLLDGAATIKKVIARAKELGMKSLAITDHGAMYGVVDFYKEAKANGIKPIIGCEVYVAPRTRFDKTHEYDSKYSHLILLAENEVGYKNLIKVVSAGFIEGFYYKPRVDFDLLKAHSEGIIVLSACLAGEVPKAILNGNYEGAKEIAKRYIDAFGKDNYFIEIQDHGLADQKRSNPELIRLARELGVGLVATNDIHYVEKKDWEAQDVLMCIQMDRTVDDPERMKFETQEFYLKSGEEMENLFSYVPEALENTVKIAERCNVDFDFNTRHLPSYAVPDGKDHFEYLHDLCYEGLTKKYKNPDESLKERLDYELSVIKNMGFVDYFLIVWDFIHYAKNNGVMVGPGRGSAAGSIVAYTLGITEVDPIRYNLLFERFLNPARVSMPDIDTDFEPEGRQKVINYVIEKYGADKVSQIITFGTMKARLAIRDVGRALSIPYSDVDKVAKLIPADPKMTIDKALDVSNELKSIYENDARIKKLIDTAKTLEGLPRHKSTHAAGVVITEEPTVNYIPMQTNDEAVTTQFVKDTVEELGLLKMDFLGLKNLTIIENALNIIEKTRGEKPDFSKISYDIKDVYDNIATGNTDGIFQIESAGMKAFMQELKPMSLEDITAGISLYRPGPMDSIPTYIYNKNHPEEITYKHPLLKDILDVTYGCMVYQEQVMQIVRTMAGYSLGDADLLRRVISKKKMDKMEIERQNFIYGKKDENGKLIIKGCVNNGIDEKTATDIFNEMYDFANYAFNKSHAAAYAYITYQTAYLKTFYPIEFMASLISSTEDVNKANKYIVNAKKMGIELYPPDINKSTESFSVEDNAIRFGLSAIKNVGKGFIQLLVAERERGGLFTGFSDFISRMIDKDMNKRSVESLIMCGAFDSFGIKRAQIMEVYEDVIDSEGMQKKGNLAGQFSLFDDDVPTEITFPEKEEFPKKKLLAMEKETIGMYLSGHPLDEYSEKIEKITKYNIGTVIGAVEKDEEGNVKIIDNSIYDGMFIRLCGIIDSRKNKTTRNNSQMAFVTLNDMYASIEVLVFPKVLMNYSSLLQEGDIVLIEGKLSMREDEEPKLLCENVYPFEGFEAHPKNIYIKLADKDTSAISRLKNYAKDHKGDVNVCFYIESTKERFNVPEMMRLDGKRACIEGLEEMFGKDCVKAVY